LNKTYLNGRGGRGKASLEARGNSFCLASSDDCRALVYGNHLLVIGKIYMTATGWKSLTLTCSVYYG